ncbi:hypothetical protein DEA8626_04063 [Defluviimonas aquaemixtae]|uniref:Uncharacterized protein n=1 Tax=Albidovulum aquaemixtae TaxID=1542388 RepID=A0A2R8BNK0_9RHOB|nr:hypothetical protein DEA8626_04063 [Defluviimonas aquaemixtae]
MVRIADARMSGAVHRIVGLPTSLNAAAGGPVDGDAP